MKNERFVLIGKEEIGYIKYEIDEEGDYIIQTIFIEEIYRGNGYAKIIFNEFIKKIAKENKKVIPICSYAKKQFEKNDEIKKLLKTKNY